MGEAAPEEVTHQESSPTRVSQRRGRRVSPPQQTLEVRAATSSDLDAIVLLRMALLHEEAKSNLVARLRPDAPQRARALFAAELASERGITLLASIAGQAIGVVRCSTSRSAELVSPSRYAYLSWAWVRPEYRRQGVLRALVAAAEQWSRERGLSEMRLRVTMDNAVGDAAWSALGFAPVELVRRRPIPSD
jgi:aminoglycoside 6'-N-acetyltransferase I